mgnify:CR=1 FL=1
MENLRHQNKPLCLISTQHQLRGKQVYVVNLREWSRERPRLQKEENGGDFGCWKCPVCLSTSSMERGSAVDQLARYSLRAESGLDLIRV